MTDDFDSVVVLTWSEMMQAAVCGAMRNVSSIRAGNHKVSSSFPKNANNTWTLHIEGAAGELAFAKYAGLYWSASVNTFRLPDVGAIQVRARSQHWHDLIIRERDIDDDLFVLLTGASPRFVIRGWIVARDAKARAEWFKNPGESEGGEAAWFVPQVALRPWKRTEARVETEQAETI